MNKIEKKLVDVIIQNLLLKINNNFKDQYIIKMDLLDRETNNDKILYFNMGIPDEIYNYINSIDAGWFKIDIVKYDEITMKITEIKK